MTYRRKVLGGEEEWVRELVFVSKNDAREREMGVERTGLGV